MVNAAHSRKAIKARVCLWTACSCASLRRKIQRVERRGKGFRILATGEDGRLKAAASNPELELQALTDAVERPHGAKASFLRPFPVDERFSGAVVWRGCLQV